MVIAHIIFHLSTFTFHLPFTFHLSPFTYKIRQDFVELAERFSRGAGERIDERHHRYAQYLLERLAEPDVHVPHEEHPPAARALLSLLVPLLVARGSWFVVRELQLEIGKRELGNGG